MQKLLGGVVVALFLLGGCANEPETGLPKPPQGSPTSTPEATQAALTAAEHSYLNALFGSARPAPQNMSERSLVEAGRELCERLSSRMVKRDEAPPAMVAAQQHLCPASDFAEPPAPPGPAISFGDGLHLVGTDIQPGTYRSPATECYWERLSGVSGDFEDLITNGNGTIVEIMSSDYAFNSSRCGTWERIEG